VASKRKGFKNIPQKNLSQNPKNSLKNLGRRLLKKPKNLKYLNLTQNITAITGLEIIVTLMIKF